MGCIARIAEAGGTEAVSDMPPHMTTPAHNNAMEPASVLQVVVG